MTTRNVSQIPIPGMMMNTPAKSAAKSEESTTDFMQIMGGSLLNTANPNQMDEGISSPQKSDDLKVSKMVCLILLCHQITFWRLIFVKGNSHNR